MFQPPSEEENEKEYIKQEIKGMTAWKQKELIELIISTTENDYEDISDLFASSGTTSEL